jgi:conjugal transfer/type IV secretion protein DotA/TraY
MQQQVAQFAAKNVAYGVDKSVNGKNNEQQPEYAGELDEIVSSYQENLQEGFGAPDLSGAFMQSADEGWASAGAFFNVVARTQADAMDVGGLIPETKAPEFGKENHKLVKGEVLTAYSKFEKWIGTTNPNGVKSSSGSSGGGGGSSGGDSCTSQRQQLMTTASGIAQKGDAKNHLMERIFQIVDWIAGWNCVWKSAPDDLNASNFSLGVQFTSANPLAEMAHLGHANINTSYDVFDLFVNMMLFSSTSEVFKAASSLSGSGAGQFMGNLAGKITGEALSAIGGMFALFTVVFFTSGVLLAFMLPLIPFFRFLFNVMTWVVSVLEAVIAVPLIALAHLNPEGDGLPGPSAKTAYYFIFSIFLRPVMMVFGLIVGLLVFYVAVSYMNLFYMQAITTSGGLANGHLFLSRLVYSALYVVVLYMCANSAFKCVNWLPEHAVKWAGGQPLHIAHMGDPEQLQGPLMQATALFDQQLMSSLKQGGAGAAFAVKEGLGGKMGQIKQGLDVAAHKGLPPPAK